MVWLGFIAILCVCVCVCIYYFIITFKDCVWADVTIISLLAHTLCTCHLYMCLLYQVLSFGGSDTSAAWSLYDSVVDAMFISCLGRKHSSALVSAVDAMFISCLGRKHSSALVSAVDAMFISCLGRKHSLHLSVLWMLCSFHVLGESILCTCQCCGCYVHFMSWEKAFSALVSAVDAMFISCLGRKHSLQLSRNPLI